MSIDDTGAARTLEAAWLLRQHVIPTLRSRPHDLVSLALSCAPLLGARCAQCVSQDPHRARRVLLDAAADRADLLIAFWVCSRIVLACTPLDDSVGLDAAAPPATMLRAIAPLMAAGCSSESSFLSRDISSVFRAACDAGLDECAIALLRPPFCLALGDLLSAKTGSPTALVTVNTPCALVCSACRRPAVLRAMCEPPLSLRAEHISPTLALDMVDRACGAQDTEPLAVLSSPPLSLGLRGLFARTQALRTALKAPLAVMRALAAPPFCLGREEAVACKALSVAAHSAEHIRELALPPWSLAGEDARGHQCLASAAVYARPDVLQLLSQPPWCLTGDDARGCRILDLLNEKTSRKALRVLAKPPYSLGHEDARGSTLLARACRACNAELVRELSKKPWLLDGSNLREQNLNPFYAALQSSAYREEQEIVNLLRVLVEPPYSIGEVDAKANGLKALRMASGSVAALKVLEKPPFCLSKDDAVACGGLAIACSYRGDRHSAEVLRLLSQPPWNFAHEDAVRNASLLLNAMRHRDRDFVRELGLPPWSLGRAEAISDGGEALGRVLFNGDDKMLELLGQPPYSLTHADIRDADYTRILLSTEKTHAEVVELLKKPPFQKPCLAACFAVTTKPNAPMEENGVFPDVLDKFAATATLDVAYAHPVANAKELTPSETRKEPRVTIGGVEASSLYTLLMTDPDAPSRTSHKYREWLHWIVYNIPGSDLAKGEVATSYMGPSPPKGTGKHRYVFVLYKQSARIESFTTDERPSFKSREFASEHGLTPVAGVFFFAQNH
eukprot:m51a1_g143 hypothetical protein (790) ;mRNA; r:458392-463570